MRWIVGGILVLCFLWSYATTIGALIDQWERIPDYSHGFLVVPLALFLLWMRYQRMPMPDKRLYLPGVFLIVAAGVMRVIAARYYLFPIDGYSIPIWFAGCVMLLAGWRVFVWALPGLAFLVFMIPLPYGLETALALPLQTISTEVSCFVLQCFLQPAITARQHDCFGGSNAGGRTCLFGDADLLWRGCIGVCILDIVQTPIGDQMSVGRCHPSHRVDRKFFADRGDGNALPDQLWGSGEAMDA